MSLKQNLFPYESTRLADHEMFVFNFPEVKFRENSKKQATITSTEPYVAAPFIGCRKISLRMVRACNR